MPAFSIRIPELNFQLVPDRRFLSMQILGESVSGFSNCVPATHIGPVLNFHIQALALNKPEQFGAFEEWNSGESSVSQIVK